MFGFGLGKHKRTLTFAFADCFAPLKDELGNVPIPMQTDPAINAAILGACEGYAKAHNIKPADITMVADAVFEELYRRESIEVQNRVDGWKSENNAAFSEAYQDAKARTDGDLNLSWLTDYASKRFEPATGKML